MVKLFTHDDLDAAGCVVLGKLAFKDDLQYVMCDHRHINEAVKSHFELNTNDECHITDITVSKELAEDIDESGRDYWLFDHHPTALAMNEFPWCEVRINNEAGIKTSGTEIYYEWLINRGYITRNDTIDRFVQIIRDYDTWRWAELGDEGIISKQINDLFYIYKDLYGVDAFINWALHCIQVVDDFPCLYDGEKLMLRMKQKEIDAYVVEKNEQLKTVVLSGRICGVVFADKHFSELGNRLCTMHPEIDFVAMIDLGHMSVSYRAAKDDINVGEIAKSMGGGGHPKAAGSKIAEDLQKEALLTIFGNRME